MPAPRVLVVDDDDAVRAVAEEMLRRGNYNVESVAGGREALDVLKQASFDLILLDVGMPGMSGVEVYQFIRRDLPTQKVLYMTGYAEDDITDLDNPNTFILVKPFSLKIFNDTVASIVQSAGGSTSYKLT
jgi:CheY-like chemotaxis protein